MAVAYDFRDHSELVAIRENISTMLPQSFKDDVLFWCRQGTFRHNMQLQPGGPCETMTLQELADLGANDPVIQRIDVKAISNILTGPHGIAAHGKTAAQRSRLCEYPRVITRMQGGEPIPGTEANASGRHRNFSLQILLDACDVPRDLAMEQQLYVIKQLADTREEWTAAMLTANAGNSGPRRQSAVERMGASLGSLGIEADTKENLLATYQGRAKVTNYSDVFAMFTVHAVADVVEGADAALVYEVAKRAYSYVYRASADNRVPIKRVFTLEPQNLTGAADALAAQWETICDTVSRNRSVIPVKTRIAELLSNHLADFWSVSNRTHPNEEEVAEKKLTDAKNRVRQFEEALS